MKDIVFFSLVVGCDAPLFVDVKRGFNRVFVQIKRSFGLDLIFLKVRPKSKQFFTEIEVNPTIWWQKHIVT